MRLSHFMWLFLALGWLALLTCGWYILLRHEFTPGSLGTIPERWPHASMLPLDREQPTLLLFAHRNCPCTRATLQELESILTDADARVRVVVVLLVPQGTVTDRVGGAIEQQARSMPWGVVTLDPQGIEARRFGVRTSGHILLYGTDGQLCFSGGITEARGHAGSSSGKQAVSAFLRNELAERTTASVFGCSLFADEDEESEEHRR